MNKKYRLKIMPSKRLCGRLVLASAISFPLLWLLLERTDFSLLRSILMQGELVWLWAAACFMGGGQLVGALRICQLLKLSQDVGNLSFGRALVVSCAHQASQRFLPLRLGEVVMLWMVFRLMGAGAAANLRSWVVLRLWDFRFVAVGFAVGVGSMFFAKTASYLTLFTCFLPALLLIVLSPLQLLVLGQRAAGVGERFFSFDALHRLGVLFQEGIFELKTQQPRVVPVAILAFLGWLCSWMVFYCLLQFMRFDVGLLQALGITCGVALVSAIPLQTVAGLGMNETGQVVLFVLAGARAAEAVSLSLAFSLTHMMLCLLVPGVITAITSLCLDRSLFPRTAEIRINHER